MRLSSGEVHSRGPHTCVNLQPDTLLPSRPSGHVPGSVQVYTFLPPLNFSPPPWPRWPPSSDPPPVHLRSASTSRSRRHPIWSLFREAATFASVFSGLVKGLIFGRGHSRLATSRLSVSFHRAHARWLNWLFRSACWCLHRWEKFLAALRAQ